MRRVGMMGRGVQEEEGLGESVEGDGQQRKREGRGTLGSS